MYLNIFVLTGKAVANDVTKSHNDGNDDGSHDLTLAGFGGVPSDKEWLEHVSSGNCNHPTVHL